MVGGDFLMAWRLPGPPHLCSLPLGHRARGGSRGPGAMGAGGLRAAHLSPWLTGRCTRPHLGPLHAGCPAGVETLAHFLSPHFPGVGKQPVLGRESAVPPGGPRPPACPTQEGCPAGGSPRLESLNHPPPPQERNTSRRGAEPLTFQEPQTTAIRSLAVQMEAGPKTPAICSILGCTFEAVLSLGGREGQRRAMLHAPT